MRRNALLDNFRVVELTQPLHPHAPTWNGSCGFCLEIKKDYDRIFRVHQLKMHAGVGTHMDAPSHRIQGGASIAEIRLEQCILPACVINVSRHAGPQYEISVNDMEEHEKVHGQIPEN